MGVMNDMRETIDVLRNAVEYLANHDIKVNEKLAEVNKHLRSIEVEPIPLIWEYEIDVYYEDLRGEIAVFDRKDDTNIFRILIEEVELIAEHINLYDEDELEIYIHQNYWDVIEDYFINK